MTMVVVLMPRRAASSCPHRLFSPDPMCVCPKLGEALLRWLASAGSTSEREGSKYCERGQKNGRLLCQVALLPVRLAALTAFQTAARVCSFRLPTPAHPAASRGPGIPAGPGPLARGCCYSPSSAPPAKEDRGRRSKGGPRKAE